jgi:hypothetical protein
MEAHHFTLEEANALLPWLKGKLQEIRQLRQRSMEAQELLQETVRRSHGNGSSGGEEGIRARREEVENIDRGVRGLLGEVEERNIIVRDPDRGLVDFPSLMGGDEVYLCWVLGEDQVRFWHDEHSGFNGRQPL